MANPDKLITELRTDVQQVVHHIEQAQMIAQRAATKYNSMGGDVALAGFTWPEGYTQADFTTAMSTIITFMPTILSDGRGTNLYRLLNSVG